MAKLALETVSAVEVFCISEVRQGVFVVVAYPACPENWIGTAVAISSGGGRGMHLTGPNTPEWFDVAAGKANGMRVRPMKPGEKLVCVE
jgi:oxalate decarboxylase/phosphoglucose isomerase-like protein (cupin superfamily)